jgi:Recombinase zinc beta ribbon domain
VEEFTHTQLQRRAKAAGGLASARQSVRGGRSTAREYLLRGLVTCGACSRRMQGATIRKGTYYRCTTRTMAPGSPALADHPLTVNLREDHVVEVINDWLNGLFARENRDTTVAALLDGQSGVPTPDMDEAKARRADAEARLRRYQRAIGAGVEPAALVDAINQAQAERTAAQAYIDSAPLDDTLDVAEVYAMLDAYNELVDGLRDAPAARLARLYRHLDLSLRYLPDERAVFMRARPRVDSAGVRGGTPARKRGRRAAGTSSCVSQYNAGIGTPSALRE